MADQWYFERNGKISGPLSPELLKQLADAGSLDPSDLVWQEASEKRVPASKVRGLFAAATISVPPVAVLPPPARSLPPTNEKPPVVSHASPPSTAEPLVLPPVREAISDAKPQVLDSNTSTERPVEEDGQEQPSRFGAFIKNAKAAGSLVAKQAERTKLKTLTLPSVYQAFGKQIYEAGLGREGFGEIAQAIDAAKEEIAKLEQDAANRTMPSSIGEKSKAVAEKVQGAAKKKAIDAKINREFVRLGEEAIKLDRIQKWPAELAQPVRDCLTKVEQLDSDISRLSASDPKAILTPKRIAISGIVMVVWLFAAILYHSFNEDEDRPSAKNPSAVAKGQTPTATNKLSAVEAIVKKLGKFPDRFASESELSTYNKELDALVEKFIEVPFDAKNEPKIARQIIELYEAKIESRYTGFILYKLDEHILQIFQDLRSR